MCIHNDIIQKLNLLEQSLKEKNLWGGPEKRPNNDAFLSKEPFFLDTMEFHQWLEYVLISRLRYIIANNEKLPEKLLVHTIAEEYYRGKWSEFKSILHALRELDKCFN